MILIADSGSTKTHWHLLNSYKKDSFTQGLNPFYQTNQEVYEILINEISPLEESVSQIYFLGAGCNYNTKKEVIKDALLKLWPHSIIKVENDLLGTCFATSSNKNGICCILGKGSNSCLFNVFEIVDNISPLGYILGDEGSGAHLGKTFVNKLLKRHFPEVIEKAFFNDYKLDTNDILKKIYQQELPNRFLASLTHFIKNGAI